MGKNRPSIEAILNKVKEAFAKEPELARLFETCYTNTLDTTVKQMEDGTTHVITGDIPAMWLRDSTAQLRPYLIPAVLSRMRTHLMKSRTAPAGKRIFRIRIRGYGNRSLR